MKAMDEADGVKGSQMNDVLHDEIVFVLNWTDTHKKHCLRPHTNVEMKAKQHIREEEEERGHEITKTSSAKEEIPLWASHPAHLRQHYSFNHNDTLLPGNN